MDKNVSPASPRFVYIPDSVSGFSAYQLIHDYVYNERPPSGGFMLVAPKAAGGHQFYDTPYTNFNKAKSSFRVD